ncbi:hypothetical protein [Streptomyces sp. NPDC018693]|uniref:hypothetical protein n=1 Tax=unclassified Streptomyces TaxID=2593676 RepID=UPI0037BD655B
MGSYYQTVVDLEASAQDAARLAEETVAWLVATGIVLPEHTGNAGHLPGPNWQRAVTEDWDWKPSGDMTVRTGRQAFHSGSDMPEAAVCPHCTALSPLDDDSWSHLCGAIDTWYATGEAYLSCPACAVDVPLPDWAWDSAPFAFGYLGFEFRDWPDLSPEFVARLPGALRGHRTTYLWGKL